MIYLDNAATSYPKPRGMVAAMEECILKYCGNPGRSGHSMSMRTGEEVYHARRKIAGLFGIRQPERLVFTKNTTEALNMGLKGVLQSGDHVITTTMEHNSLLRPLKALEKRGVSQSVIRADREGFIKASEIEKAIRKDTKLIAITAASNVTGTRMPLEEIGELEDIDKDVLAEELLPQEFQEQKEQEAKQSHLQELKDLARANNTSDIIINCINEFYSNEIYKSDFLEKVILLDCYGISQPALQHIRSSLLLDIEIKPIELSKTIVKLMRRENKMGMRAK